MRYLSLCSGIEAASVAWHPLGWEPWAFSEIEAFPSAVLQHHYPEVPNLGDITRFKEWPDATIDVLVGGTPCQSFSVAGLRKGLADPRGNLALTYLAIADRYRPEWLVWENVPGVLSSEGGRDFGAFLGGLGQLGYGWAYRVLDAQYCRVDGFPHAVPQRRRRVFVVGNSRDWRRAAAVLFERSSLSGDPPPRREAGQRIAPTIASRPTGGGGLGTDFDCDGGLISGYVPDIVSQAMSSKWAKQSSGPAGDEVAHLIVAVGRGGDVAATLQSAVGGNGNAGNGSEMIVAHSLRADGFDASEDGTGRVTPIVPVAGPLGAGDGERGWRNDLDQGAFIPIAFDARQSDVIQYGNRAGPIDTDAFSQAVAYDMRGREDGSQFEGPHDTANIRAASGGSSRSYAVAFAENQRAEVLESDTVRSLVNGGGKPGQGYPAIRQGWAVRRLTPVECERLQGFPDGYTAIPYRGKPAADGPRYKALGNSMACNVMRWLGRRIDLVRAIVDE